MRPGSRSAAWQLPVAALALTTKSAPKYIILRDMPCMIASARLKKKATNQGNDRIEVKGHHIQTGKLYVDTIEGRVMVPVLKVAFAEYSLLDVDPREGAASERRAAAAAAAAT